MKKLILGMVLLQLGLLSLRANTLVEIRTAVGDLVLELFDDQKPVTVQNFLRYVREGRWVDMFSHRIVPGFIVQGGGFGVTHRGTTNVTFVDIPDYGMITNEFSTGPRLSNTQGTIAMAKIGGQVDSASSEWFINLADNGANLDNQNGGFTVFGRVVSGKSTLDVFNSFTWMDPQPTNRLYNLGGTGFPFNSSPNPPAFPSLSQINQFGQIYTNLLFLEVSEVHINAQPLSDGRPGIRWNSLPGITNVVEMSRELGGGWQVSTNLLPATRQGHYEDLDLDAAGRFYRVRLAP